MFPSEFNAVLTTDWQILRLDAAKSFHQTVHVPYARTACFEYINNPRRLGIFARQICVDRR